MTHPRQPPPTRRLSLFRAAVLAGVAALGPHLARPPGLAAQDAAAPFRLELSMGGTSFLGEASAQASVAALLGVSDRISVGGMGSILLGMRTLPGSVPGTDAELRTALGGVVVQVDLGGDPTWSVWLRLTSGLGNAKQNLAVAGTRIAADNFGVLLPELGITHRLTGPLHVGAALGYRATFGVEDLPGVSSADLRGPSGRLLISLRHF